MIKFVALILTNLVTPTAVPKPGYCTIHLFKSWGNKLPHLSLLDVSDLVLYLLVKLMSGCVSTKLLINHFIITLLEKPELRNILKKNYLEYFLTNSKKKLLQN